MNRVLVIQHEAYEVLGTIDNVLRREKFRIKYVNFERTPDAVPSLERYHGLILLGGYMGVYEADQYHHLKVEMKLIEEALKRNLPILGICLGSQILAHVLGAQVRKHHEREMGWLPIHLRPEGVSDPLLSHFKKTETVFQSHGDTFDVPQTAIHLAFSPLCESQAFRYGKKVYGLQFHLEVNDRIVQDWFEMPQNQEIFKTDPQRYNLESIRAQTHLHLGRSMNLSEETFKKFLNLFEVGPKTIRLHSGHGRED